MCAVPPARSARTAHGTTPGRHARVNTWPTLTWCRKSRRACGTSSSCSSTGVPCVARRCSAEPRWSLCAWVTRTAATASGATPTAASEAYSRARSPGYPVSMRTAVSPSLTITQLVSLPATAWTWSSIRTMSSSRRADAMAVPLAAVMPCRAAVARQDRTAERPAREPRGDGPPHVTRWVPEKWIREQGGTPCPSRRFRTPPWPCCARPTRPSSPRCAPTASRSPPRPGTCGTRAGYWSTWTRAASASPTCATTPGSRSPCSTSPTGTATSP